MRAESTLPVLQAVPLFPIRSFPQQGPRSHREDSRREAAEGLPCGSSGIGQSNRTHFRRQGTLKEPEGEGTSREGSMQWVLPGGEAREAFPEQVVLKGGLKELQGSRLPCSSGTTMSCPGARPPFPGCMLLVQ